MWSACCSFRRCHIKNERGLLQCCGILCGLLCNQRKLSMQDFRKNLKLNHLPFLLNTIRNMLVPELCHICLVQGECLVFAAYWTALNCRCLREKGYADYGTNDTREKEKPQKNTPPGLKEQGYLLYTICPPWLCKVVGFNFLNLKEGDGAEGGTRTRMDFSTRPSNVRVYQFHHFGK